ncbi:MAG: hypothetical protein ACO2PM_09160 [Pyrobaculum sp.]|jgi:hypothetical protein
MEDPENSSGGINTRETPSAADAAVALLETLTTGCVDRETLRRRFVERFGGDRNAARVYFNLALRRLAKAGKVAVTKSGETEVICRSGELTEVIERWGDLIDALTWKSEGREIDPDMKTNGRIIVYLVRRGMLRALTAFLCRGTKVWAYLDDPVDLSLILDALRHVIPQRYLIPQYDERIPTECRCPNGEITLFVPRRVLFSYMATAMVGEIRDKRYVLREEKYVLKLPGGQTASLARIKTDCGSFVLRPAVFQDEVLPLVIYFVRVVD